MRPTVANNRIFIGYFIRNFLFEVTFLSQKKVTKKAECLCPHLKQYSFIAAIRLYKQYAKSRYRDATPVRCFRSGLAPSTFFLTKKKADIKELEVKEREYLNPSP